MDLQYALAFPGELMMRGIPNSVHSPQENVWALYSRAMLLWNSCLMLRKAAARMTDAQRAEFAVNIWLETNTIEEALNRHTCAFERNTLFQGVSFICLGRLVKLKLLLGREYLFKCVFLDLVRHC
jgi:hypothetical protein